MQSGMGSGGASIPLQVDSFSLSGLLESYGGLIGNVFLFVAAFVAVYLLGTYVFVPVVKRVLGNRGFDGTVMSLADSVLGVVVWAAAIGVAFTVVGFGSVIASFSVLGGAIALAVGFAAQDLIGNFVAGVFILKDKPFDVGDWIEWNDRAGVVEDIDLRVSRVRTFDNERVTVPNSELADNAVTNPVAYDELRQTFVFGIGYDDDIDRASEIIREQARTTDQILDDPAPDVRVTELGDSAVGLQSRFWVGDPARGDVVLARSEFVQRVKERFDAEGIDMPYPYRELTGELDLGGQLSTRGERATVDD